MTRKFDGSRLWLYDWDFENRLASASNRKQTVRYLYDALGRRVQRFIRGGRENTKFIYDGQDVLVDDNNGTLTKYLNGAGIDNKLRVQTGSDVKYFLTDHLGSTNGLVDSSGNLTASTAYDSFGNATNANFPTRYQFTGREYDNFSGLHYYRARFYDANLGRFISEDPIGFAGDDINLYGYVWNSPLLHKDSLGLWGGVDDLVFAGGGAVIGVAGQGIGDIVSGKWSSWQDYTGAAVGGALSGEVLLYTGSPILAGAAYGAASNITKQRLNIATGKQCSFDWMGLALDTGVGAATGYLPGPKIPGINSGRNSFLSLHNQMVKKFQKGIISNVTAKTAGKMFIGKQIESGVVEGTIVNTAVGVVRSGGIY